MRAATAVTLGLLGLLAILLACQAIGVPLADGLLLVGISGGVSAAVGVLGAWALRVARAATFWIQASLVALTAVTAVAAGAIAAGVAMFQSGHDLLALGVVVATGAEVGIMTAFLLARRVDAVGRSLDATARGLTDPATVTGPPGTVPIRELAAVERQLRETGARLRAARASEAAADRARRELVAWVSHDLRTPLAGIRAIAEALEDGIVTDPATVRRYHATLREEADRLGALVDDLFELSRVTAGPLALHKERVSLGELVADAAVGVTPVAERKGVRLDVVADGGSPELPVAVPELMRVLRNLLANAVRESPPGGTVTVTARADGPHGVVEVADTCGGIAEEDLPRVFDTAYRGSVARTPRADDGGAGLGLAIARGLVDAHGGDIAVRNTGPGCEFRVRLPLDPVAEVPATPPA